MQPWSGEKEEGKTTWTKEEAGLECWSGVEWSGWVVDLVRLRTA